MPRVTKARIRAVLGEAPKPIEVWQRNFDYDDDVLRTLARCEWDEISEDDLGPYILDLTYQELQPDLFRLVFPACIKFWCDSLMANRSTELGGGDFNHAMIRGRIFETMLNDDQRRRLFDIFVDGLLDRLDGERGFKYVRPGRASYICTERFNSIGLIAPIIPEIWNRWWSFATPGQAVSAIMYASGLVYLKGENPIYRPWTPHEGGGGPYLAEWDAAVYDHAWLEENLAFLRSTLSPGYVVERLRAAADSLRNEPEWELADRIASEAVSRAEVVELRIDQLLTSLAQPDLEKDRWD